MKHLRKPLFKRATSRNQLPLRRNEEENGDSDSKRNEEENGEYNNSKRRSRNQSKGPLCRICMAILSILLLHLAVSFLFIPSSSVVRWRMNTGQSILRTEKISVVLMNYGRPENIRKSKLMPTLLESDLIGEVLLTHNNPDTAFEYNHPKVRNILAFEEEENYGLSSRFWFCAHSAKYPWVIHVDDDMVFPNATLEAVVNEFARDPDRIVGIYGRLLSYFFAYGIISSGYSAIDYPGKSDVVLTKLMIMPQKVCRYFHDYEYLVKDFVDANSHPHWNGEDIFMSLVTNHVYNHGIVHSQNRYNNPHKNFAMPWMDIQDVGDKFVRGDGYIKSISGNMKVKEIHPFSGAFWIGLLKAIHHVQYRGTLWRLAAKRLEQTAVEKSWKKKK